MTIHFPFVIIIKSLNSVRKCRNWQTSKTKDLVAAMSCEFKSHLPHFLWHFISIDGVPFLHYDAGVKSDCDSRVATVEPCA